MARPPANIDWNEVNRYLEAGSTGTEIAGFLGMHEDTLYRRCQEDHNIGFAAYSQQKKARGEALLRARQYQQAMKGNTTLLIWLGKCRLGQQEPQSQREIDAEKNRHSFVNNLDEHIGKNATPIESETD